ncbi:MAG: 3-deoxy-manno-octulosonate cytidylyltransferase [Gammaproteobacteria bacterium]|nr:3-deoxy-manno-octulosonate cytidylyltransferase [Gammaproteobacteria bacterium]
MSEFIVVIPARFASERLPGKPLRAIAGKTMLEHVYERGRESDATEVIIATDDQRIEAAATSFGADVCMTAADHGSGTDRLAEVARLRGWPGEQVVVNLQGDEPLMPAALVNQCALLLDDDKADISTLASPLASREDYLNPNVVKVVCDADARALYFSRAPIPHARNPVDTELALATALHHHGIYGYRSRTLQRIVASSPSDLETCEHLEQLRALSLGMVIKVGVPAQRPGPGIDTEDDLAAAQSWMSTT